jgi:TolB-like protein
MAALLALALASTLAASSKVAVMPVASGEGVPGRTAEALTEAVTAQVRRYAGVEVVTQKEILAVLTLEQQKQMLGCQTDSCMAELGGALGVDRMITGDLAKLGESWLFHLKLVDAVKVKVVTQSDRRLRRGSIDDVLDVLPAMVVELFPGGATQRPAAGAAPAGPQAAPAPVVVAPVVVAPPPSGGDAALTAPDRVTEVAIVDAAPRSPSALLPLPPPTAPMPAPESARRVPKPWVESSIPVPLPERGDLAVYTDDHGHYLALAPFESGARRVFAGTAEKLFVQEVLLSGAVGTSAHGFSFWDPRARSPGEAFFEDRAGKARLVCGARELPLRALSRKEADGLLRAATFYAPRWRREPHVLAQDDEGNFFYVDRARAGVEPRGPDYRLYAGPLGKVSRIELSGVADGPDGLVLLTASGKLRLGRGADGSPVVDWLAGGGRRMLRALDPRRNGALVYQQLGVYGSARFGTACDGVLE